MKRFLRGSSSQSSKEKASKPKYNLPRTAEVRAREWPFDDFLRAVDIYEDFHELAKNAGLTAFLHDQREQYLFIIFLKVLKFFRKRIMSRRMYQGGSSRKQGPSPAIREMDNELPRYAQVRPCEWPSEDFMVREGIKEEFDAYVCNADLESFEADSAGNTST